MASEGSRLHEGLKVKFWSESTSREIARGRAGGVKSEQAGGGMQTLRRRGEAMAGVLYLRVLRETSRWTLVKRGLFMEKNREKESGWAALLAFQLAKLRGRYDRSDPRTWSISPKSRVLDTKSFPLAGSMIALFADGKIDSIGFAKRDMPTLGSAYELEVRSGDIVGYVSMKSSPGVAAAAKSLCDMDNIALVRTESGPVWIARDGARYDRAVDKLQGEAEGSLLAEKVGLALSLPDSSKSLNGIVEKLQGKDARPRHGILRDPEPERRRP